MKPVNKCNVAITCLVFAILFPLFSFVDSSSAVSIIEKGKIAQLANALNLNLTESTNNVMSHVHNLSSFQSRVPGYSGHEDAAEYIINKFMEYGLEPGWKDGYSQYFNLTVPLDFGTEVKVLPDGPVFKGYALWPNLIQSCKTPEEGLTGKLIYAGTGTLKELNGKDVESSIALMDFNSGKNWLNLVKLGAKGVIFIEPDGTTRIQAENKFLLTPLYFPRIYISKDAGEALMSFADHELKIRVKSEMTWVQILDRNIIGVIPGTTYPNDAIIFAAHYDDWSIVPSLAPGADDATGIGALLELARLMKEQKKPPLRTTVFVALSGHWEAIAGAREFAMQYIYSNKVLNGSFRPWVFIEYDFSTDSERIGYCSVGVGTWVGNGGGFFVTEFQPMWRNFQSLYLPALREIGFDTNLVTSGETFELPLPTSNINDAEAIIATGRYAFTFRTTYSFRISWETPFSTFDTVNPDNLKLQLTFALYTSFFIANQDNWGVNWLRPILGLYGFPDESWGVNEVIGDIVIYDKKTGFYTNKPLLKDNVTILAVGTMRYSRLDPFSYIIVTANEKGEYRITGVPGGRVRSHGQYPEYGASYTTRSGEYAYGYGGVLMDLFAYALDNANGTIMYAKDLGDHGESVYQSFNIYSRYNVPYPTFQRIVVFKCGTLVLFDVLNPATIKSPEFNINRHDALEASSISIEVRRLDHTRLEIYGETTPSYLYEDLILFFYPSEWEVEPVEIIFRDVRTGTMTGLLRNSTEENPDGVGYIVQSGEQKVITFTSFHMAQSLNYLNQKRLNTLHNFNIWVPEAEELLQLALKKLSEAESSYDNKDYEKAYLDSLISWSYGVLPYRAIFASIQQVLTTSVFFSLLLIPFAFMLEKIAFSKGGKVQVALISTIFAIVYYAYSMLSPTTTIASNSIMVIIGMVVMMLTFFTFYILIGGFINILRMFRLKVLGPHFTTGKFASVLLASWSVGIGDMRRRRMRTFLFLATLIITFTGLVSMTSITSLSFSQISATEYTSPYDGMLIQMWSGGYLTTIPSNFLSILENEMGNVTVYPRSYIFFPMTQIIGFPHTWLVGKTGEFLVKAALGLTPQETEIVPIDKFLQEGEGRWFQDTDLYVAIVSETASKTTGIKVGDEVSLLGLRLRVIGIISDEVYSLKDIGDIPLSPQATVAQVTAAGAAMGEAMTHVISFKETILIPYKLAEELDGKIYSVAVKSENKTQMLNLASQLSLISGQQYSISISFEGKIYSFGLARGLSVKGTSLFLVPMLISTLMVFNLMLGSVYERRREISILSVVGLAPSEISTIFIAQSTEYAVLSVVIGYLSGILMAKVALSLNVIPMEIFPQFTSMSMLITMTTFIVIVMSGSIYPAWVAGRLVNPSLKTRWEISEPVGDMWEINMPFISDKEGMEGFLFYLSEYLKDNPDENYEIEGLSYGREVVENQKFAKLNLRLRLAPFATQTVQEAKVGSIPERRDKIRLQVLVQRLSGPLDVWKRGNRNFISVIRKQMLIWRSLETSERLEYIRRASSEQ